MNLEYHKGQFCDYKPVFCQEGYCSECFIYYQNSLCGVLLPRDATVQRFGGQVSGKRAIAIAIKNNKVQFKYTNLGPRLTK